MTVHFARAAMTYAAARPATAPEPRPDAAAAPSPHLARVAQAFARTLQEGEAASLAAMEGRGDTHRLVHALTQSALAVETAVAVRNKVVEAYQEILRMPV
jgi:flagellar hook-basal body complex protein FliE